ncbi:MAG: hypothetical protein MI975_13675 [Cytophagales bacterium]|nr:hypothetical protein [Cytophagales bacterium]
MQSSTGKKVFVAKVSDDMLEYKENLVKDLMHHGCTIREADPTRENREHIREIIERCDAALHILSDRDFDFDESGKGVEEQQINYAVQFYLSQQLVTNSSENDFTIYAWHPKSSTVNIFEEEHIPGHLKKIQQFEEVDLIRTNFEDFKYYLLKKIEFNPSEKANEFYIKGSENLSIYLMYDAIDEDHVKKYADYLKKRGFNLFTPEFQGEIPEIRQRHVDSLKNFDIAIVFSKESSMNWVNMKVMDILKSPGMGRVKKIKGKAVFLSGSEEMSLTPIARSFKIISTASGSPKEQLEVFLQELI